MAEVEFLFDEQLIAALNTLIKASKHKLILISPYIDLDERIVDALKEKKARHDFELKILFGKNENNYKKSMKKDSMEFFKQFPNVEIRYNERLHAKFYQNDFEIICTSLNLYDYSLANNIEVGIKAAYASKGLLGKATEAVGTVIITSVDKVRQDVLGMKKEMDPIEKFQTIFNLSELLYKTSPKIKEKKGFHGALGFKELDGYTVVEDKLTIKPNQATVKSSTPTNFTTNNFNPSIESKKISASKLSQKLGMSAKELSILMESQGFIKGDAITELGILKGLVFKSYMGKDYIAYPEDILILQS